MLKNYIITTIRNLKRNSGNTIVALAGLIIGIYALSFSILYAGDELSFDTYHPNASNTVTFIQKSYNDDFSDAYQHLDVSSVNSIKEVLKDFIVLNSTLYNPKNMYVRKKDNSLDYNHNFIIADENFQKIIMLPYLYGNPETTLSSSNSIVLCKKTALKLFGDKNPIGEKITLSLKNDTSSSYFNLIPGREAIVTVTGVLDEWPKNSALDQLKTANFLSADTKNVFYRNGKPKRAAIMLITVNNLTVNTINKKYIKRVSKGGLGRPIIAESIENRHLFSKISKKERLNTLKLTLLFGILIFFIASVNLIFLFSIRISKRTREIIIRKCNGANNVKILSQFFIEAAVLGLIALIFAFIMLIVSQPFFPLLFSRNIIIHAIDYLKLGLYVIPSVLVLSFIIVAIPFFISINKLPGILLNNNNTIHISLFQKLAILIQTLLTIMVFMIFFNINSVFSSFVNSESNLDIHNVLQIKTTIENKDIYKQLKSRLLELEFIHSATSSSEPIYLLENENRSNMSFYIPNISTPSKGNLVEDNFLEFFEIKINEGLRKPISENRNILTTVVDKSLLLENGISVNNDYAIKIYTNPRHMPKPTDSHLIGSKIIGSYEGYNPYYLPSGKMPSMFIFYQSNYSYSIRNLGLYVLRYSEYFAGKYIYLKTISRLNDEQISILINLINSYTVEEFKEKIEYSYIENKIDHFLSLNIHPTLNMLLILVIITMLLTISGIFSISRGIIQQHQKELCIHKIYGADLLHSILLIFKKFIIIFPIAIIIVIPFMHQVVTKILFLLNYKTTVSLQIIDYIIPILVVFGISIVTAILAILKDLFINPSEILNE